MSQTAKPLTFVQQQTLDAIKLYMRTRDGIAPTIRELASAMGKGHCAVYEMVSILRDKGWITMEPWRSRSIQIVGRCSMCGRLDEHDKAAVAVEAAELMRLADDGGRA